MTATTTPPTQQQLDRDADADPPAQLSSKNADCRTGEPANYVPIGATQAPKWSGSAARYSIVRADQDFLGYGWRLVWAKTC